MFNTFHNFIGMILGIPLGLIGFIMLLAGLFTSGSKTVIVNPQQTQHIVINHPVKANRYCSQCGTGISLEEKFCTNCGNRVS